MFRRKYYFSLIIILLVAASNGQTKGPDTLINANHKQVLPRNIFYGQLFGDIFLIGVNYEKAYTKNRFVNLSARLGIGIIGNGYDLILGNNILFGKKRLIMEAGINPLLAISGGGRDFLVAGNIGFRYYAKKDGLFLKLVCIQPYIIQFI